MQVAVWTLNVGLRPTINKLMAILSVAAMRSRKPNHRLLESAENNNAYCASLWEIMMSSSSQFCYCFFPLNDDAIMEIHHSEYVIKVK